VLLSQSQKHSSWGHDSCVVGHVSVICERSLTYSWHRVCVLSSPYCCCREAKQKCRCIRHLLCFVSELSSSTKPAKSDNVQNFGYRGYSNRDIIGTAISFLSDIHLRNICYLINQHAYQYLVFIVIPFPVLARQWICLWSYHHFHIPIDIFEARGLSFHICILPSSPPMQLNQYEKKVMGKLTSSSSNIERMIPVWQFFQSEWRTQVRDWVWTEGERMSDDSNWSSLEESETMVNWSQTRQQTSFDQRLNVSISLTAHMTMHWHLSSTNLPKIC